MVLWLVDYNNKTHALIYYIQLFQLRLSPEQSGKVEYERESLLGIANKFIDLLAIPSRYTVNVSSDSTVYRACFSSHYRDVSVRQYGLSSGFSSQFQIFHQTIRAGYLPIARLLSCELSGIYMGLFIRDIYISAHTYINSGRPRRLLGTWMGGACNISFGWQLKIPLAWIFP